MASKMGGPLARLFSFIRKELPRCDTAALGCPASGTKGGVGPPAGPASPLRATVRPAALPRATRTTQRGRQGLWAASGPGWPERKSCPVRGVARRGQAAGPTAGPEGAPRTAAGRAVCCPGGAGQPLPLSSGPKEPEPQPWPFIPARYVTLPGLALCWRYALQADVHSRPWPSQWAVRTAKSGQEPRAAPTLAEQSGLL